MRRAVSRFVLLCGAVLVALRIYSSRHQGVISQLFFDNVVHDKIETLSVQVISALALPPGEVSQPLVVHFASLAHVVATVTEVIGIALTCYVISRCVRE
jgi:hypothetical protein